MPDFIKKLQLDPPLGRVTQATRPFAFFRLHDAKYIKTESDIWTEFADASTKWRSGGRYAGEGLNCGYYCSGSKAAAISEMTFYRGSSGWRSDKSETTISTSYDQVLNLTEPDSIDFVFDRLLEFPYRRRSFRLALLASITAGGNLFTDYIGGWAYHKGFRGVMFLSARALEPHRDSFDSSILLNSSFARFWTNMSDELDFLDMELLENDIRKRALNYLNIVFFNGPLLITSVNRYSTALPDGRTFAGLNPHYQKSPEQVIEEFGFDDSSQHKEASVACMQNVQAQVDAVNESVHDSLRMHAAGKMSNQLFGSWMEEHLLSPEFRWHLNT